MGTKRKIIAMDCSNVLFCCGPCNSKVEEGPERYLPLLIKFTMPPQNPYLVSGKTNDDVIDNILGEFEQIFIDNPSYLKDGKVEGGLLSFCDELHKMLRNSIGHNSQVDLVNFTVLFTNMVIGFMVQKKYPTWMMSLVWDWHEQTREELKKFNETL